LSIWYEAVLTDAYVSPTAAYELYQQAREYGDQDGLNLPLIEIDARIAELEVLLED